MIDRETLRRNPVILITGGTGALGTALLQYGLKQWPETSFRVYSRDEYKQYLLREMLQDNSRVSYLLGDVRDLDRLRLACRGTNVIIHAAALKRIEAGELNTLEFVATNVQGSANVVRAAIDCEVGKAILISSDKAVSPCNSYGISKSLAERIFVQGNVYAPTKTVLQVVRWGNVINSRGGVLEIFRRFQHLQKPFPVTSLAMSRFWFTLEEAIQFLEWGIKQIFKGGLFVPMLPAFSLHNFCQALKSLPDDSLQEGRDYIISGKRPGEKIAEEMMTNDEYNRAWKWPASQYSALPYAYCIPPILTSWMDESPAFSGWLPPTTETPPYRSDVWPKRLSVQALRERLARIP